MVKKILSISIGKNSVTLFPVIANNKKRLVEEELIGLDELLIECIKYIYTDKEITIITYGSTDGLFYTDFKDTITVPENGIPKIDYYLSFTKCSEELIRRMIKEIEYWMDSIYLTSLTKKDYRLLNNTLKQDLKVEIDTLEVGDFSHVVTDALPDFFVPVDDGNGFEIYNPSKPLESIVNKIKEIADTYGFELKFNN